MSVIERERVEEVVAPEVTEADVLHRAADLIEEYGWCQGVPGSKASGQFCIRGAIREAILDLTGVETEVHADARVMKYDGLIGHSWPWNDSLPRGEKGKRQVLAALRSAAERAS